MKRHSLLIMFLWLICGPVISMDPPAVVGLCIAAPSAGQLDRFLEFMEEDLAPGGINTLVVRVDFNYAYESHPELRDEGPLTNKQVKSLVDRAGNLGIRLIPQINLLGHQSWAGSVGNLLEVYPEFDETPSVEMPDDYQWPNEDGLYCKSYCPLHPGVHQVVFALVDEIMEAFEADAFHAGMDEVFYIGMDECPRCNGRDRAELFAGELTLIRNHLAASGNELWIWGDRLIDGHTTGMGMWEASENGTHHAIRSIPRDIVICDWHYERADPTAAYFALEGFRVISCPWNRPSVTREQLQLFDSFRRHATDSTRERYHGFMQTVWSTAASFMDQYEEWQAGDTDSRSQAGSMKEIMNFYIGRQ